MLNAVHQEEEKSIGVLPNEGARNPLYSLASRLMQASLDKRLPILPKLFAGLRSISEPLRTLGRHCGREDFHHPATRRIPDKLADRPQVIHAHNLFGNYFDLRELPRITRKLPFVLTLHDMWAFTGHCSHPLDCKRWRDACGQCPHLELPPALPSDGTASNLALKKTVYSQSRLHVATPSQWLMDQMDQSVLRPGAVTTKIIPNGVDQRAYRPGNKAAARQHLGLPSDAKILLFVAAGNRANPWKDYDTLERAAQILAAGLQDGPLILLAPGAADSPHACEDLEIRSVPWVSDPQELARYYHAADLYLHAAHAENFPNVILEALSCGLPVIGTETGGIPEQIDEGRTGHVVPQGDAESMAGQALSLLSDMDKHTRFCEEAARTARGTYCRERMGRDYLDWFEELLATA